jgi:hypothetical protein
VLVSANAGKAMLIAIPTSAITRRIFICLLRILEWFVA